MSVISTSLTFKNNRIRPKNEIFLFRVQSTISPQLLQEMKRCRIAEEHRYSGQDLVFQYYWLGQHPNVEFRRESFLNYYNRPDLDRVCQDLFNSRRRMAQALGFSSFAERALLLAAIGPNDVRYFLETLSSHIRPYLNQDIELLKSSVKSDTVGPWDINCIAGYKKCDITNYLNIYNCLDGFSKIAKQLFGVELVRVDTEKGETWHNDVMRFNVVHHEHGDYGHMAFRIPKSQFSGL